MQPAFTARGCWIEHLWNIPVNNRRPTSYFLLSGQSRRCRRTAAGAWTSLCRPCERGCRRSVGPRQTEDRGRTGRVKYRAIAGLELKDATTRATENKCIPADWPQKSYRPPLSACLGSFASMHIAWPTIWLLHRETDCQHEDDLLCGSNRHGIVTVRIKMDKSFNARLLQPAKLTRGLIG